MKLGCLLIGFQEKGSDSAKDLSNCSRRLVIQSGATLASIAILNLLSPPVEALETTAQASPTESLPSSGELSGADPLTTAAASKPKKPIVDTGSWYRFRGEGFAMKVPPEFEDVVEYDVSNLYSTHISGYLILSSYLHPVGEMMMAACHCSTSKGWSIIH